MENHAAFRAATEAEAPAELAPDAGSFAPKRMAAKKPRAATPINKRKPPARGTPSRKPRTPSENPFRAKTEGKVEKISEKESDEYFKSRPLDHRIGAWASPQSQVIASRTVIEKAAGKFSAEYPKDPPRPRNWGGYRLKPALWEFWQGRKSRLHDRLRYRQEVGGWKRERLAP